MARRTWRHVWRVEGKCGKGAYCAGIAPKQWDLQTRHPPPYDDKEMGVWWREFRDEHRTDPWYFGFATLKHYRDWFNHEDRQYAADEGGKLVKYHVPKSAFKRGDKQAVFIKSRAIKVAERACDYA